MPRGNSSAADAALQSFVSRNRLMPPPVQIRPLFSCKYCGQEVFPTPEQKAQLAEGRIIGFAHLSCVFKAKEAAER